MSKGKRGTCNYKMMTFRIHLKNLKYIEWYGKGCSKPKTKGQAINIIISQNRKFNNLYHETEENDPKQTTLKFE